MRVSLVSALAQHLHVEETEAAETLQEIVLQIREAVARDGRVEVPEVGTFSANDGDIEFTPAPDLLRTVNADLEGLSPIVLPPVTAAPRAVDEGVEVEEGDDGETRHVAEASDAAKTVEGPDEFEELELVGAPRAFEEPEMVDVSDVRDEPEGVEVSETREDPDEVVRPDAIEALGAAELGAEEVEFAAGDAPAGIGEDSFVDDLEGRLVDEFAEPSAGTEAPDDEFLSIDEETLPPLPGSPVEPEEPQPEAAVHSGGLSHHHPDRTDRPPEMHARPIEVTEKKKPKKRRAYWPMLVIGVIIMLAVLGVAYLVLVGLPGRETVVEVDDLTPPVIEEPTMGGPEGELATEEPVDGEQVADAGEDEAVTSAQQSVAVPGPAIPDEPAADGSAEGGEAIDVGRRGWTIVVGSEATAEAAQAVVDRFRSLGHDASVIHGTINGVSRYRVVVNQFDSEREATAFLRSSPAGFPTDAWLWPVRSDFELIPTP